MTKSIVLHVDAKARGKCDGSAGKPFGSLQAARDALRKLRRGGRQKAVRVEIQSGVYRLKTPLVFKPEDGGSEKYPVTWVGVGGRPIISGARVIDQWRDGSINGMACWQADLPDVKAGTWWFTQLFINGRRRLRARLPKQGFYRFAGVPEEEAKLDPGGLFHGAMCAHFQPNEVKNFRNLSDIDVVVPDHWYENHLRVARVDEAAHTIHFETKGYSRFSRDETARHTRFRLDHVAEGCTEPGEWYLDRSSGTLSYIPLPGEAKETVLVEAPALDYLVSVQGDAANPAKRVSHLRFAFLDFRHADWELPRNNPGALQSAFQVPAAVRFSGAEDCALYGCQVSQVAGWGVEVLRGCERNRIMACALFDLGAGGVKIGNEGKLTRRWIDAPLGSFQGMDPEAFGWGPCEVDSPGGLPGRDRIPSSATTVSDCSIHDGGIIFHSAIGVWIGDASRNRVLHNHIYNFNYSGISCGWTWGYAPACTHDNRIEGNHVHAIGHGMLSDMGAIYTLGRQAGSTISRNYIHDVYSYGYGGWGIYTDEGSSWIRIEENVVCNTKSGGLHQHYGRDNILRHNLFADAIENQIMVSRTQMMRSVTFENNLVQGAGGGRLWSTPGQHAIIDRNVYARSVGRPEKFDDKDWAGWQATGNDVHGRLSDAMMLDTRGALIAPVNDAAFNAAGIPAKRLAAVIAEAGPRLRDGLPSLDKVFRREADKPLPIVEPLFWPWSVDWPTAANWNRFPGWESTSVPFLAHSVAGQPKVASLTLENKGAAIAKGRYRFTVIPARAAKLTGPSERTVSLKPGARQGWDITFVPTGKESTFRIEAKAEGAGLFDTCLYFSVAGTMDLPRLASKPECARLVEALSELPLRSISANPNPIKASVRLAVAEGNLLLALDVADAKPLRGEKVWEGSCVELFGAVKVGAVERQQLILAPGVGTVLPTAQRIDKNTPITAEGVEVVSVPSTTGWQLLAVIPLSTFGVEPGAASFALDLVVNAARPDGVTRASAYLASDQHPYGSTVHYLEVSVK